MGERPTSPLDMDRRVLSSGMEVVWQPPPASARTFSLTFVAPAGWGFDSPGTEGLATVAAKMVVGRPGGRSREALARELDRLGGSLTSTVDAETAEVTVWGPDDAWTELLGIFRDAVFHPLFEAEELGRTQRQMRERQLRERVQPDLRAGRDLMSGLFPRRHPYATTGLGTSGSVGRISPEALRRFHRRQYLTRGSRLAVTGRGPRETGFRLIERVFGPETQGREPARPPLSVRTLRTKRLDVTVRGQSQVAVRVGAPSEPRSSPRFPELFLANEVLGGRPLLSRLFQLIREQKGLAYHASSDLQALRWSGYWQAAAGTDPATRDRVVRLMVREVERLAGERVSAAELDRIRESALGSLPLELETTASAHDLAVDVATFGLPVDFYRTWPARLRSVRPRELQAAAEEGFALDRALVVTAGPPGR